jgi:hypothetical protein
VGERGNVGGRRNDLEAGREELGGDRGAPAAEREELGGHLVAITAEHEQLGGGLLAITAEHEQRGGGLLVVTAERERRGGYLAEITAEHEQLGEYPVEVAAEHGQLGGDLEGIITVREDLGGYLAVIAAEHEDIGAEVDEIARNETTLPAMLDFLTHPHRAALRETPLSDAQRAIVEKNVASFASFDAADQAELAGLMQVFLAEKSFEGCGGLELTEEMKVTIAAEACILLLHRETAYYPDVESILVYPAAYRVRAKRHDGAVVVEGDEDRLGESWSRGTVVLAWDHVKADAGRTNNAHNLVLHEFAHQLDGEDGDMNGVPDLGRSSRYGSWGHVLAEEFEELTSSLYESHGKHSDIDAYGATNPSEFFAVVTEMFFGKPAAMKDRHPALYEQLAGFYKQDPAAKGATG